MNCCVVPSGIDGALGETAMETSTVDVTVRFVEPVIPPKEAEMEVLPGATVCAIPVLSMVATDVALEFHVTVLVRI